MNQIVAMPPTTEERYRHLRENAEAFVEGIKAMIAAAKRNDDTALASKLEVWCLNPWMAALRDDDTGDLWFTCEVCSLPIKQDADRLGSDDGCWFHRACVDA